MSRADVVLAGGILSARNSGTCLSCAAATAAIGRMKLSLSELRSTRCFAVSAEPVLVAEVLGELRAREAGRDVVRVLQEPEHPIRVRVDVKGILDQHLWSFRKIKAVDRLHNAGGSHGGAVHASAERSQGVLHRVLTT